MGAQESIHTLLALRKVTRAMTEVLRAQMTEYLATLTPLLRPRAVFGDYVQGGSKEGTRKADKAFKELQALYDAVAAGRHFSIARELQPPLDIAGATLEITPIDYPHEAGPGHDRKVVNVRSPLRWYLNYTGFSPVRVRELAAARGRNSDELQRAVLHVIALHVVLANQPGVTQMLEALHFGISTVTFDEFGQLPLTCISSDVTTRRPSDEVILQSAELTGMDAFEEVVNLEDVERLRDPLKDKLSEIARGHVTE